MTLSSYFHSTQDKKFKVINLKKINKLNKKKETILPLGSCFLDIFAHQLIEENFRICYDDSKTIYKNQNCQFFYGNFINPLNLLDTLERVILKKWKFNDENFIKSPIFNHYINLNSKARLNTNSLDEIKNRSIKMDSYLLKELQKSTTILLCFDTIECWIDKINGRAWYSFYGNLLKRKIYKNRAYLKTLDTSDLKKIISKIVNIIHSINHKKKIILMTSPHNIWATFTKKNIQIANLYGKSCMSSVFQEIESDNVSYFPVYEILQNFDDKKKFENDYIHTNRKIGKKVIIPAFKKVFF